MQARKRPHQKPKQPPPEPDFQQNRELSIPVAATVCGILRWQPELTDTLGTSAVRNMSVFTRHTTRPTKGQEKTQHKETSHRKEPTALKGGREKHRSRNPGGTGGGGCAAVPRSTGMPGPDRCDPRRADLAWGTSAPTTIPVPLTPLPLPFRGLVLQSTSCGLCRDPEQHLGRSRVSAL